MGRLVEYAVAHEVGHTLGLQHNMKASSMYPADSVRSRRWVHRMGHTPTLMDYSRFNYVAQPEDSIPVADLVPRVGPYDVFAIQWGYTPIPGARSPDDERIALDTRAQAQDTIPWYRFSTSGSHDSDPGDEAEAVGDADPVKSTALGLRNIQRTMPLLAAATLHRAEDNSDLEELYGKLVDQWGSEMEHVTNLVGGSDSQEKYGSQPGPRFTPVPAERQRAAVRFIAENAFRTPRYLLDPDVLRRIEPEGALRRIGSAQSRILLQLLDNDRLTRLSEYEALAENRASIYPLGQLLGDVRRAVWSEASESRVVVDPFRRYLQRAWLAEADAKLNATPASIITSSLAPRPRRTRGSSGPNTDARALMRGELIELDTVLRAAINRAADRTTRLHLIDSREEIRRILDPEH
jgi:hypothetical protein